MLLLLCLAAGSVSAMTTWRNSTVGIHAFLTFDSLAANASIRDYVSASMKKIDFSRITASQPAAPSN